MSDALADSILKRVLAGLPKPRPGAKGDRGPRGFDGADAEVDADEIRAEVVRALAGMPISTLRGARGMQGDPGPKGDQGDPGPQGEPGSDAASWDYPIHADFERDPITKLTRRLIVMFSRTDLQITPVHDHDGSMVAADFLVYARA